MIVNTECSREDSLCIVQQKGTNDAILNVATRKHVLNIGMLFPQ